MSPFLLKPFIHKFHRNCETETITSFPDYL